MIKGLGIGVGEMAITMKQFQFRPGDVIQGVVSISLAEPIKARGLFASLVARQRAVRLPRKSGEPVSSHRDTLFNFRKPLAQEGMFTDGHYPFEIEIPPNILQREIQPPNGAFGDVVRAISFLSFMTRFPVEWRVEGILDLPWKINLRESVHVTICE